MLSEEALHQLHIFIFVLGIVHVVFCVTTLLLGGAKVKLFVWINMCSSRCISKINSSMVNSADEKMGEMGERNSTRKNQGATKEARLDEIHCCKMCRK